MRGVVVFLVSLGFSTSVFAMDPTQVPLDQFKSFCLEKGRTADHCDCAYEKVAIPANKKHRSNVEQVVKSNRSQLDMALTQIRTDPKMTEEKVIEICKVREAVRAGSAPQKTYQDLTRNLKGMAKPMVEHYCNFYPVYETNKQKLTSGELDRVNAAYVLNAAGPQCPKN